MLCITRLRCTVNNGLCTLVLFVSNNTNDTYRIKSGRNIIVLNELHLLQCLILQAY